MTILWFLRFLLSIENDLGLGQYSGVFCNQLQRSFISCASCQKSAVIKEFYRVNIRRVCSTLVLNFVRQFFRVNEML